ncbi:MAG: BppU family phage baseplate upper protein [Mariprofundaceae bacterium]|nr:BppU family phage baseplate upper protein [Mariprofundaceae bacterium]
MSSHYDFVASDTGSKLVVTCKNADTNAVISLSGATVTLRYSINGQAVQAKTMSITDAAGGVAEYQFAAGDLVDGELHAEVEITDASGFVITQLIPFRLTVRAKLA